MAGSLYKTAAKILEKILKRKGTAKSLVTTSKYSNKKKLLALVCETLKYRTVIEEILVRTNLLKLERQLKHAVALVLLYDFLFGRGIQCGGKLRHCIIRNKSNLSSALARLKVKAKVTSNEELLPKNQREKVSLPRYVRVNTLKTSVDQAIKTFEEDGFKLLNSSPAASLKEVLNSTSCFVRDQHLSDLLVFSPGTDLHDNKLYLTGKIIFQDKASCFPAHVLKPPAGAHVIDACSAPGNKTSHLASLMNNYGRIYAFDIDSERMETLKKQMKKVGASCVTAKNVDFLKVNPMDPDYERVEYILVDPSCSGSGIVSRMDHLIDDNSFEQDNDRLESLSSFQLSAVKHAMSFPSVKRVVYSTCSIHQKENEDVVENVLRSGKFQLGCTLPSWTRRGHKVFPEAERCVRALPEDHTNGFFVALFERKEIESDGFNKKFGTSAKTVQPESIFNSKSTVIEDNVKCTSRKRKSRLSSLEFEVQSKDSRNKMAVNRKRKFDNNTFCNSMKPGNGTDCLTFKINGGECGRENNLPCCTDQIKQKQSSCSSTLVLNQQSREKSPFSKKTKNQNKKRRRKNPITF